jgi:RNA polymerase sigma-70 factor, ECF subfamily
LRDYRTLADNDLVAGFRSGDRGAGNELCHRYRENIERYCSYLIRDHESARDAAQETFLRMIGRIDTLRDGVSFRAWLFAIARNNCLMGARRSRREIRLEDSDDVWDEGTPLTKALDGELRDAVLKAVRALKPVYREALVLREFESFSYREIADATDASIASVKFRLHTARQALAKALGPYFNGEDVK